MSLIFFKHKCRWDTELGRANVNMAFIIYNPDNGETGFFNVVEETEPNEEDGPEIIPFNEAQMAIVNRRYREWCCANPDMAVQTDSPIAMFDKAAYESFMRTL